MPLTAKPATSLPPPEALLLFGGPPVQEWLSSQGLLRWQYEEVAQEVRDRYRKDLILSFVSTDLDALSLGSDVTAGSFARLAARSKSAWQVVAAVCDRRISPKSGLSAALTECRYSF